MRATEIRNRIKIAQENIQREMRGHGDGLYQRGFSPGGYAGGYLQALCDVLLLMSDVEPNDNSRYWTNRKQREP